MGGDFARGGGGGVVGVGGDAGTRSVMGVGRLQEVIRGWRRFEQSRISKSGHGAPDRFGPPANEAAQGWGTLSIG